MYKAEIETVGEIGDVAVGQVFGQRVHLNGGDPVLEHVPSVGAYAFVRFTRIALVQEDKFAAWAIQLFGAVFRAHVYVGFFFAPLVVFRTHSESLAFAGHVVDGVRRWVEAVGDIAGHRDVQIVVQFRGERWFVAFW